MKRFFLHSCAIVLYCITTASIAGADAISSYTVTDLGPSSYVYSTPNVTFSDTGDNGTLTTPTGAVYAFPRTDNLVANPQPILSTFPPFTNGPIHDQMTYGNPNFAYSYLDSNGVFLNNSGHFVATDLIGVDGHAAGSGSIVYTATQQPNGTFGPLSPLWSASGNNTFGTGQVAQALDLNNAGLVLGVDAGNNSYYGSRDFFLYNLNTGLKTELASLLPTGWTGAIPIAIDDQGRILVSASAPYIPGQTPNGDTEFLLLTPAGLSSSPLATPEPSTFVFLAVAGAGLMVRRRWKKATGGGVTSKASK